MLQVAMMNPAGAVSEGGVELVEQWRETSGGFIWVDITGELKEDDKSLLKNLGCHELAIMDCERRRHPPKVELFDDNIFVLFRGLSAMDEQLHLEPLQIGFFIGDNYLVTVHRQSSISVNHQWQSRNRDRLLRTPLRLALSLLHYSAGLYLEAVLAFEDHLEELEDQLLTDRSEEAMRELVAYRSRLRRLRRVFSYHEKLTRSLLENEEQTGDSGSGETVHAIRDLYDRCERLYSLSTMYYELCGDLVDGYLSITSHQLNQTMKVLTVITAIFIPLGFLVGLYGMNFEYMPELQFRYAYFVLIGVLLLIAASLIVTFKRIRWI